MAQKKHDETQDADVLQQWIEGVGGSISLGESILKDVDVSKDGDRITIIIKRKKPKKSDEDESHNDE